MPVGSGSYIAGLSFFNQFIWSALNTGNQTGTHGDACNIQ
ncbi:hypothetical protein SEEM1594_21346 [Salmonella enterica subsp. enterica serovar Muenchen str. baa1594]|nr:hypothetical protein SEEM1594_21346 [Salmonella enterica subsp. enterica serovar Muenchen str. baa1594]